MKKIVIFILLFIPIFVSASSIEQIYIDSEVDISGNLIIKELIKLDEYDKPLNFYYANDFGDKLYKSSGISITKIGKLIENYSLEEFYSDDFTSNNVIDIDNYTVDDDGSYLNITFDEQNIYYIEYIVLNVCAKHKDSAELYYRYLYNFNYNVKKIDILTRLSDGSKLFNVYAYGIKKAKVIKDTNGYLVLSTINNYKTDNYFDIRILYDRDLFSISINKDKETNFSMVKTMNNRRRIYNIYNIIITFIFITILIILLIYNSYIKFDVSKYTIKNKKIDKNYKLMFLSDLHNREVIKDITKIVLKEKPDIIIMGGDMVNENIKDTRYFIKLCKALVGNKIYYTFGNHESTMSSEDMEEYLDLISKLDIELLNNSKINLSKNIKLYGFVSDLYCYRKFYKTCLSKEYIENKIGKLDNNKYNIIIAHNPLEFKSYVDYNPDLVLSGHVHGGLIKLPLIGALFSPDYTFFPKYSNGEYNKNNTKMIVSRGLGFSKRIPIRINNPAEVVIINLMKDE